MNKTRTDAWSRREFVKRGGIAAVGITCFSVGLPGADAEVSPSPEDPPSTHNMLVVGQDAVFLSHLPMFDGMNPTQTDFTSPHRYQVILEATFTQDGKNVQDVYAKDRRGNPRVRMYTLSPTDRFVLSRLFTPTPQQPTLNTFKATVFRGHLERPPHRELLTNVLVTVKKVIHARKFDPTPDKPGELTYVLFGAGLELFLAHRITKPPDFDQILSVKLNGTQLADEELKQGMEVVVLGRANVASQRIKEKETVSGRGHVTGAHQFVPLPIQAGVELYFEEGELLVPPTFQQTPEEKKAGF